MNIEDLAENYIKELLVGCYKITDNRYPNIIFYFYSKRIIRQKKLCKILGEDFNINKYMGGILVIEIDLNRNMVLILSSILNYFLYGIGILYSSRLDKIIGNMFGDCLDGFVFDISSSSMNKIRKNIKLGKFKVS